jgi:hypothetical protein
MVRSPCLVVCKMPRCRKVGSLVGSIELSTALGARRSRSTASSPVALAGDAHRPARRLSDRVERSPFSYGLPSPNPFTWVSPVAI